MKLFLCSPGRGRQLHRHDYDEVFVVPEGRATCVAGEGKREVQAGDVIVSSWPIRRA